MKKPASLRQHIIKRIPYLHNNPDKLSIVVEQSSILVAGVKGSDSKESALEGSLSFEYKYQISVAVIDFAGEPEHVIIPIIEWLQVHQPDLTDNRDFQNNGLRFDADVLDTGCVDMMLVLEGITESILVGAGTKPSSENVAERFSIRNGQEPQHIDLGFDAILAD